MTLLVRPKSHFVQIFDFRPNFVHLLRYLIYK